MRFPGALNCAIFGATPSYEPWSGGNISSWIYCGLFNSERSQYMSFGVVLINLIGVGLIYLIRYITACSDWSCYSFLELEAD